jgi:hypothetical protein
MHPSFFSTAETSSINFCHAFFAFRPPKPVIEDEFSAHFPFQVSQQSKVDAISMSENLIHQR